MECPVCYNFFDDPTILNCGHTFCKKCSMQVDKCPSCRTDIISRQHNYIVNEIKPHNDDYYNFFNLTLEDMRLKVKTLIKMSIERKNHFDAISKKIGKNVLLSILNEDFHSEFQRESNPKFEAVATMYYEAIGKTYFQINVTVDKDINLTVRVKDYVENKYFIDSFPSSHPNKLMDLFIQNHLDENDPDLIRYKKIIECIPFSSFYDIATDLSRDFDTHFNKIHEDPKLFFKIVANNDIEKFRLAQLKMIVGDHIIIHNGDTMLSAYLKKYKNQCSREVLRLLINPITSKIMLCDQENYMMPIDYYVTTMYDNGMEPDDDITRMF